jgi:hypothetical protein
MLAAYYCAVARGLAVQARDGASREKLSQIGRLAMRVWPEAKKTSRASVRPDAR